VRLCEHVSIPWATVEAHIAGWQERAREDGEVDWQGCFDSFNLECHDPSHDTRCAPGEDSTWPRARLVSPFNDMHKDRVILRTEWKPHSGIDGLTLTPDGRASELRRLFAKYRQRPASILLPAYPSILCLRWRALSLAGAYVFTTRWESTGRNYAAEDKRLFFTKQWSAGPGLLKCENWHDFLRPSIGPNTQWARLYRHWPDAASKSVCLTTHYARAVLVCLTIRTAIGPTHRTTGCMPWIRNLTNPGLPITPLRRCRNETCMHYHRR